MGRGAGTVQGHHKFTRLELELEVIPLTRSGSGRPLHSLGLAGAKKWVKVATSSDDASCL